MTDNNDKTKPVQGTLFEDDYLVRSLGSLANNPDVALTELVANAWDAGASEVHLTIPDKYADRIIVKDDGAGMTTEEFRERWMKLSYDRLKHQGRKSDYPPGRSLSRRMAYGRNGIGRHGMLCFAGKYDVLTCKGGTRSDFRVSTMNGQNPFVILKEETSRAEGHGTELRAIIAQHLPLVDQVRQVISARFLQDPEFKVYVNGDYIQLEDHVGLLDKTTITLDSGVRLEVYFIDATRQARLSRHHGIAFWVGGRLVGTPAWSLGNKPVLDARTRYAHRYTVVVKTDDLFDDVKPDWSGFKREADLDTIYEELEEHILNTFKTITLEKTAETKETAIRDCSSELRTLSPVARVHISHFVDDFTEHNPSMQPEMISVALQAAIHLEKSRCGVELLRKLSTLSEDDVEALNRLLDDWSVGDALVVLGTIDRRLQVVEALSKLSADKTTDELHTLHPLVTEARWLFGPEFDTPEYASNNTVRKAVEKVFKKRIDGRKFINPKRRPDLVVLADGTLSAVAVETIEPGEQLSTLREVLLIELKRGGHRIGRDEVHQASDYVDDLLGCGFLDGQPFIRTFVVGHEVDPRFAKVRKVGEPEAGRVMICTFSQLVRTAHVRLFRLREKLSERYDDLHGTELMDRILDEEHQMELIDETANV